MLVEKVQNRLIIHLNQQEGTLLHSSLMNVRDSYNLPPRELHPDVEEAWYQTRQMRTSGMTAEEAGEWEHDLHAFRGERLKLLEKWIMALFQSEYPMPWELTDSEADTLLMVLNDCRLHQAASHHISESEMDADFDDLPDDPRKLAMLEIYFLGWLMELVLQALSSD